MSGQGKMLAGRTRASSGGKVVQHAVDRFRERWPEGSHLTEDEVKKMIQQQADAAIKAGDWIEAPGGRYVLFSFMGEDGYAVVAPDGNITTLLFESWCPAVTLAREKKRENQSE